MIVVHPHGTRIALLSGHVIVLEKNEPTEIPDFLAHHAFGAGAVEVPAEGEAPRTIVDVAPKKVETVSDKERLVNIFVDIMTRNVKEELRQDKQPRNAVLQQYFGRPVTEDERNEAYTEALKKLPAA